MRAERAAVFIAALAVSSLASAAVVSAPAATTDVLRPAPTPQEGAATPAGECCRLVAGTLVAVELAEPVGTATAKRGDRFAIKLAEPIEVGGRIVMPAGASGVGEVVDAAAGGVAGRPAKLILAARYVESGGVRAPLNALHLGGAGRDNATVAAALGATPYIGVLALAIPGGNVEYPAGTRASAKVAADVIFAAPPATASATLPLSPLRKGKP